MNVKACSTARLSQFELSKITLKNLHKFKLSPTSKLVLLSIVDYYPNIFPSQKTIADNIGVSRKSVVRAINELRNIGLILTTENDNQTLTYKLTTKFFTENNLSQALGQKVSKGRDNLGHKQIREQNNNKRKYFHNVQETGINYPKYQPEQIKKSSPLDFTKEQAEDYLNKLLPELQQCYFAKELRLKYNLS